MSSASKYIHAGNKDSYIYLGCCTDTYLIPFLFKWYDIWITALINHNNNIVADYDTGELQGCISWILSFEKTNSHELQKVDVIQSSLMITCCYYIYLRTQNEWFSSQICEHLFNWHKNRFRFKLELGSFRRLYGIITPARIHTPFCFQIRPKSQSIACDWPRDMGCMLRMMTSLNGNISALLALCAGISPVTGEFPSQRPVTRSFNIFSDMHRNKWLNKQPRRWWSETPSSPLWRHCNYKNIS